MKKVSFIIVLTVLMGVFLQSCYPSRAYVGSSHRYGHGHGHRHGKSSTLGTILDVVFVGAVATVATFEIINIVNSSKCDQQVVVIHSSNRSNYYNSYGSVQTGHFINNGNGSYSYIVPSRGVKFNITEGGGVRRIAVSDCHTVSACVSQGILYIDGDPYYI